MSRSIEGKLAARTAPRRTFARALSALVLGLTLGGCATVRPEQRAILADPVMQFESDAGEDEARRHVLENREGSLGGGAIKGGGCGCN